MEPEYDENPNPYASPASPPGDQDPHGWEPLVPGEVLRIEGVLAPKDLLHANQQKGQERPADRIHVAVVFLVLFLGTAVPAIGAPIGLALLSAFFLALAIGFGYAGLGAARRIRRYWRQRRGVFRFQRIEITEEGIRQQTEDGSAAYGWNVFATYTASKRVVILDFDPPEGQMYHSALGRLIIPRDFFLSDADWNRFVRLVRGKLPKRYRESHRNEPTDPHPSAKRQMTAGSDQDPGSGEASSKGEIIRIGGTLSRKDLFAANKLAHQEKPSDVIVVVVAFSALFLGSCVGCAVTRDSGWLFFAAIFLALAVGLGLGAFRSARRIDRYWRHRRGIFRPQRVEITEEWIRQQTDDNSVAYRWTALSQYAASKRVVILHFDPPEAFMHSMRGYLILPREFFPGDADWDRFLRLVGRKVPKKYRERGPR